jgi:glutamate synthase domain-containing protein 2/glutamate synthase domain-containing protein 1/glutamate synthase domain-containing protein 3
VTHRATLFDPTREIDSCGIGFVADAGGTASRELVDLVLEALRRVRHRGATVADGRTGDGAGILVPIPSFLTEGADGLAMVFSRLPGDREIVEESCAAEGIAVVRWREVPVARDELGSYARAAAPAIEQAVLTAPDGLDGEEAERRAFHARKRIEAAGGPYVVSLSFRTVTYKALCSADHLADFYADLRDPRFDAAFGIFHQRFSTNTEPSWERAQPFRLLCHNGEINAIQGNVNWMRAREGSLGSGDDASLRPIVDESGSDSAMLDNVLELVVRHGRDIRHGVTMLVPPAWQSDPELEPDVRDFYRYHAGVVEPWDGPAALVFTDGRVVGASLDRNGLRPLRLAVCEDGLVVCGSEAGLVDLEEHGLVRRTRLGPGQIVAVEPGRGFVDDHELKRDLAQRRPYGAWLDARRVPWSVGHPVAPPEDDVLTRQLLHGWTREDVLANVRPMASQGHEPTSSMGDDTAIAPLANRPRPLSSYFRQRFAQVTNPPIDHIRERQAMSIETLLGARAPLRGEAEAGAEGYELESFFLYPGALDELETVVLDATFGVDEGLREACERIAVHAAEAAADGAILVVSDAAANPERLPVPSLLAVGFVHHRLVELGLRTRTTLVVETGEPREVHDFACLLGYGAEAICPTLALDTVASLAADDKLGGDHPSPVEAQERYRRAVEEGVLKILSKMGISDVASYCGAQIFELVGVGDELVDTAFRGTPSAVGGIGWADVESDVVARLDRVVAARPVLEHPGFVKFRKGGEGHATEPAVVDAAHELAAAHALRRSLNGGGTALYERFAALVNEREPLELRDLLDFAAADAVPLDEVESASEIVRRFSGGAMSHGSLSAEAHETIAIAFNRLHGKSNSGEGGEDPSRFGTERNSAIKQIASGRFGVTNAYARAARELQIKIAQGSKPGEGGQLPGHKATAEIARLRHTQPGIPLISPPPHHDIYSIEDLAQLIFDLRRVNESVDVSVKLVSEAGIGLVAAGVAKALADVIHVGGADGGTGASPLSSIKHAGAPWELGLAETQQALVANDLRGRVRLRVDGGIKTGRDVVVAALLGADEVSFGTVLLLAEGCLMVRTCHVDTCPVGIATQQPELRAKFAATPEMVEAYLLHVAEDVRGLLASLGLRSFDGAVGRAELLAPRDVDGRAGTLDLRPLLARVDGERRYIGDPVPQASGGELDDRLAADATPALEGAALVEPSYEITNSDRTVGARLSGEIGARFGAQPPPGRIRARFHGTAGQSFGAFLAAGVELNLEGDANDGVGKSMSGGRLVITPPANSAGAAHVLGNTVLYGATGGELFAAGLAGERFAVRNSGAVAVVEGVGQHGCEYMTNGVVVVLGEVGRNFAAGMTGGRAYVLDFELLDARINSELVEVVPLTRADADEARALVARHLRYTGSPVAQRLLDNWETESGRLRLIVPSADAARVESEHEGTAPVEATEAAAAEVGK